MQEVRHQNSGKLVLTHMQVVCKHENPTILWNQRV
jgi:hypothetical protein